MADISARCNGLATVPCLLCVFHRFQLPLGAGLSSMLAIEESWRPLLQDSSLLRVLREMLVYVSDSASSGRLKIEEAITKIREVTPDQVYGNILVMATC